MWRRNRQARARGAATRGSSSRMRRAKPRTSGAVDQARRVTKTVRGGTGGGGWTGSITRSYRALAPSAMPRGSGGGRADRTGLARTRPRPCPERVGSEGATSSSSERWRDRGGASALGQGTRRRACVVVVHAVVQVEDAPGEGEEKDKHEEDCVDEGDNTPTQAKDEDDGASSSSSSSSTGGAASRPGRVQQRGRGRQRVARVNG